MTLQLYSQHHDHIGLQRFFYTYVGCILCQFRRLHAVRGAELHACSHLRQSPEVRAGHPAMHNIPDNRHFEALQFAKIFAHSVQVQQRLCRMLVVAVPRIDQRDGYLLRQLL
ncbi:hypothetical protein D3C81_1784840 [compost metagenome]